MFNPEVAKRPVVSLLVNVPVNRVPSEVVTVAVATIVPAGTLSEIVDCARVKVMAVGYGRGADGGAALSTNCPACQTHHRVTPRT